MCSRYGLHSPIEKLQQVFEFDDDVPLTPRWNVPPTEEVLVVREPHPPRREGALVEWGLRPKGRRGPLINARSETASTLPLFRDAMRERRCLLPADGFFEWREEHGVRQPYWISSADGEPLGLGALWQPARGEDDREACIVLTTEANELVGKLHERMPVIVPRELFEAWLSPSTSSEEVARLARPLASERLTMRRVSTRVNSVRNEGPELLDPPAQGTLF